MRREMAPKKLSTKRSRRDTTGEGSSTASEFDSHWFRSAEHQQRFEAIKGWSFHRERRVQLREDEYLDFQGEIARRHWAQLVTPMAKFDPEIVIEFYANAWPTEEEVRDMRSWMRGHWIPFDADAISHQRRSQADGFDEEAIAQLLCIPGQDFARTAAGRWVRIMRTSMTTLTQIWMTLLLSNVLSSNHNSDLPLPKCQLVYAILTQMSVHVAQALITEKSNRALGFPALITGLCQSYRVPVTPSKVIRLPITRAFIEKYCTPRQAQGDANQDAGTPPPPWQADSAGSLGVERYLQHLVRQQAANHRGQVQIHECLYRFSLSQQGQGSVPFVCLTPEQFGAEVTWPGDWPDAQAGEKPAESPGEADESQQMKTNTEALKEQMATMMEAMMSIKEIMEVNAAAIAATSTIAEVDLTPPYGLNQINHPTSDMDVNNSAPILIESRQPQTDHAHVSQTMGETHEIPHHNLVDFEPCLGYATKG
ncbi:hypothetical protein HKD37_05G013234 [Glycine soja]